MKRSSSGTDAFVTTVMTDEYAEFYDTTIRDSHERLAHAAGCDLIVIRKPIPWDSPVDHEPFCWQKARIFESEQTRGKERLCWLDADLYVRRNAPNPFELVGDGWLAADNNTFDTAARHLLDMDWYHFIRDEVRPARMLNTGFFVVQRRPHQALFRMVHDYYGGWGDQGPLSYHFLTLPGELADRRLNCIAIHHVIKHGEGARSLLALARDNHNIHFAASLGLYPRDQLDFVMRYDEGDLLRAAAALLPQVLRGIKGRGAQRVRGNLAQWFERHPELASRMFVALGRHLRGVEHLNLGFLIPYQQHRLNAYLSRAEHRRVGITPQQERANGWALVDTLGMSFHNFHHEKFFKGTTTEAPPVFHLGSALEAARLLPASTLDALLVENEVERLSPNDAVTFLTACRRSLCDGGEMQLLVAAPADPDLTGMPAQLIDPTSKAFRGRCTVDRRGLAGYLRAAGFAGPDILSTDDIDDPDVRLDLGGGHSRRPPLGHFLVRANKAG